MIHVFDWTHCSRCCFRRLQRQHGGGCTTFAKHGGYRMEPFGWPLWNWGGILLRSPMIMMTMRSTRCGSPTGNQKIHPKSRMMAPLDWNEVGILWHNVVVRPSCKVSMLGLWFCGWGDYQKYTPDLCFSLCDLRHSEITSHMLVIRLSEITSHMLVICFVVSVICFEKGTDDHERLDAIFH